MKKLTKSIMAAGAVCLALSFAACSEDDEGGTPETKVELPASKGENPFAGKSWKKESSGEGYSASTTYAFESKTVTKTDAWNYGEDSGNSETTYRYTYDAEKSLVYLAPSKFSGTAQDGKEYSYSSVSEAEALMKEMEYTGDKLSWAKASVSAVFATTTVYKYDIADKTLKLTEYFDGTFPSNSSFRVHDSESRLSLKLREGEIEFFKHSAESGEDAEYEIYPTFKDGTFSGTVYKNVYDEDTEESTCTNVGTASGTYASSGTGTENCKVTLKFTALPDSVSIVAKNAEYVLTQSVDEGEEYTLVE